MQAVDELRRYELYRESCLSLTLLHGCKPRFRQIRRTEATCHFQLASARRDANDQLSSKSNGSTSSLDCPTVCVREIGQTSC